MRRKFVVIALGGAMLGATLLGSAAAQADTDRGNHAHCDISGSWWWNTQVTQHCEDDG
jgi:hypothetical protein